MEARSAWTGERLDNRFDRIDRELAAVRSEMRQGFTELRSEIQDLRGVTRAEIALLRSTMVRFGVSINVAMIGAIVTVLLRGA